MIVSCIPPLMSKSTIRIPDEEGWRRGRDLCLQRCNHVAIEQKCKSIYPSTDLAKMINLCLVVLVWSVRYVQLCCCLISEFIDMLEWYRSLHTLAPPGGPRSSMQVMQTFSTQGTTEVYETSHCRRHHCVRVDRGPLLSVDEQSLFLCFILLSSVSDRMCLDVLSLLSYMKLIMALCDSSFLSMVCAVSLFCSFWNMPYTML